jgi:transcription antitermination factor NusG
MDDLWYALHVRPRFEKFVQTHLDDKGFETFLPTYTSKRRWSDRTKSITLPLFPSYIFCRFNVHDRLPVLITPGVNAVVGVGKTPTAVDPEEISNIRHVMESGLATQPWPYLKAGETVEVQTGPLEGLKGIIVREKGCDRLVVMVTLLMRSVSVEIDRQWVKPIKTAGRRESMIVEDLTCTPLVS